MSSGFLKGRKRTAIVAFVALMGLASVLYGTWKAVSDEVGTADFQWDAARALLERRNPYSLSASEAVIAEETGPITANQVPSCLILLWPYAVFPWPVAKCLWIASQIVFTFLLLRYTRLLWMSGASRWTYVLFCALFVLGKPWRGLMTLGQHAIMSLAFFVMAIRYARNGRKAASGALLAVGFFKYSLTFFLLPYFLHKRYYRPVAIAFAIHAALTLFAAAWLWESPVGLVRQSLAVASALYDKGYIDVAALLRHLDVTLPRAAVLLTQGTLAAAAVWAGLARRDRDDLLLLSVLAMVSIVVLYHRSYDIVVLVFPLARLLQERPGRWGLFDYLLAACIILTFYVFEGVLRVNIVKGVSIWYGTIAAVWYVAVAAGLWRIFRAPARGDEKV